MRVSVPRLAVFSILAALSASAVGRADPIINNFGLASPVQTITFSEIVLPPESSVTNQYAGFGVTFSPGLFYNTQPIFFPTASLANFDFAGNINNPVSLFFTDDQTAVAFALQTNPGTTTFTALLDGVVVEEFTAPTTLSFLPDLSQASNFYGFNNIVFNEVRILSNTTFFQLDNLQTGPLAVPEPSSGLVLIGAVFCGALVRYRRRALKGA